MHEISQSLIAQIASLESSRARYVLELRLGVAGDRPHTLQEIADSLGVSRERARQIQNKALKSLGSSELNSILLLSEISSHTARRKKNLSKKSRCSENRILRSKPVKNESGQLIVVDFYSPVIGLDPSDDSSFYANRHKISAEWARQDVQKTLFIRDGEVVCSWKTNLISKITWPSGINVPITPKEFANRMQEIKAIYPNAWSKWSVDEEQKLVNEFNRGNPISTIAKSLQRAPGGVYSRLRKLGIIDESVEYSEEISLANFTYPITGNVYQLIQNYYQISIPRNPSDKVHKKFSEDGWFALTDKLFECNQCSMKRILILRKHWKNLGRVFHRWAITCLECKKAGESRDFEDQLIEAIHLQLQSMPSVEQICPQCANS